MPHNTKNFRGVAKETTNMNNQLQMLREQVEQLKPGQRLEVAREIMMFPTMPPWTPADEVLEGIVGSAYEFYYYKTLETGNIVFCRKEKPYSSNEGLRSYVSPDRLHYVRKVCDGRYEIIGQVTRAPHVTCDSHRQDS